MLCVLIPNNLALVYGEVIKPGLDSGLDSGLRVVNMIFVPNSYS